MSFINVDSKRTHTSTIENQAEMFTFSDLYNKPEGQCFVGQNLVLRENTFRLIINLINKSVNCCHNSRNVIFHIMCLLQW